MAVLIVFGVLLGLLALALVLWLTGEGGPADIMRFWDEGQ